MKRLDWIILAYWLAEDHVKEKVRGDDIDLELHTEALAEQSCEQRHRLVRSNHETT